MTLTLMRPVIYIGYIVYINKSGGMGITKKTLLLITAIFAVAALALPLSCAKGVANKNVAQDADECAGEPPRGWPVFKAYGRESPDAYLQSLDIKVEIAGHIASTRYTMVFKNKTNRDLSGELTFLIPHGGCWLTDFAYYAEDVGSKMREAVIVEKAQAAAGIGSKLLEVDDDDCFRASAFSIPASGTRTASIGYEKKMVNEFGAQYCTIPTEYPRAVEKFAISATIWNPVTPPDIDHIAINEVLGRDGWRPEDEMRFDTVGSNYVVSFTREKYKPSLSELGFTVYGPVDTPRVAMQATPEGYYFLASVVPGLPYRAKHWDDTIAIIWDVSQGASRGNLKWETTLLDAFFTEKKKAYIHLYFLNDKLKKIPDSGTSGGGYAVKSGNWSRLKKALTGAVNGGGIDFSQINLSVIEGNEILFFTAGDSTPGATDFLKSAAVPRPIHCVAVSNRYDDGAMRLIAGKTHGQFVQEFDGYVPSEEDDFKLLYEEMQFLGTEHGGAVREVYPRTAGNTDVHFSIAGISDTGYAEVTLLFGFGGKASERLPVILDAKRAAGSGSVSRFWAQNKIDELGLDYGANRAEITALGKRFGIVTRDTRFVMP